MPDINSDFEKKVNNALKKKGEELENEIIKLTIVNKILKLQNEFKDNTIMDLEELLDSYRKDTV